MPDEARGPIETPNTQPTSYFLDAGGVGQDLRASPSAHGCWTDGRITSKAGAAQRVAEISKVLALDSEQVIPFSAHSGEGRVELLEAITDLVAAAPGDDAQ